MSMVTPRRRGGPLAFLVLVVIGWIGVRTAVLALWPAPDRASLNSVQAISATQVAVGAGLQPTEVDSHAVTTEAAAPDALSANATPEDKTILVEGLDAAPPAHLADEPLPLSEAEALNGLWMEATLQPAD